MDKTLPESEVKENSSIADLLESARTEQGISLAKMSRTSPVLLIFLRHFG